MLGHHLQCHILRNLPDFSTARVLVVGDVMLDRYWYGATSRISPEAPVPVVHIAQTDDRPGGAGNVALNVAALGAATRLLGLTGADEAAELLTQRLQAAGVQCGFQTLAGVPTITKLRVLSRHQQLLRLDFEQPFQDFDTPALLADFRAALADTDIVILSDYAKGTLAPVRALITSARQAGKPVLVDPKSRDFTIYRDATLLTPNLAEFEAVVGPCRHEADLVDRGAALVRTLGLQALLVTRGEQGMTLLRDGAPEQHFPAQAREVYDVTGAGDTVVAVLAAALAAGATLEAAVALANSAAGLVVGKLGTAVTSVAELRQALHGDWDPQRGVVSEEQLLVAVRRARAQGERLVMTNGCFDILHAGHVAYLAEAKALGDRLIVAVNDDALVQALKGSGRPINPLERRLAVLAGLASVDWVVPFSEATPARLIGQVLPDVLVKGGDYRAEDVAGGDRVRAHGGQVVILDYRAGCSTSDIIATIRDRHDSRERVNP